MEIIELTEIQISIFGIFTINYRHTHGLKFGSNVLKFGIRNKHIAMVVYHKH